MDSRRDALSDLRTAFNCPAKWSSMHGDDRVRHCTHCKLNVYNISAMSREEAVNLLEENGEKICVRFYQRADGAILTQPCGRARKVAFRWQMAAISLISALGIGIFMPVYAGAAASPSAEFKFRLRNVQRYNHEIAQEKDPETRQVLEQMREKDQKEMMEAYSRLSPEDVEELGSLIPPQS